MTDWMRARPKLTAALAGTAVLAILMLVFVMSRSGSPSKEPADFGAPLPTEPSRSPVKLPTATPSPSTAAEVQAAAREAFKRFGQGISSGGLTSGQISMPGLQGGSIYKYLPRHSITLQAISEAPIGTVGYIMPTSLRHPTGIVKNVKTSWSISSTVYGDPDYAQLFVQAGARGYPITCIITVDGKVTERRATEGPYGQMVCQG